MATTGASSLLPKSSVVLAALILLLSATQLGFHWWPDSALVYGVRVDYLSPTLYFLDLLTILYLCILFRKFGFKYCLGFSASNFGFLLPILLTNLLFSINPLATLSWSLHLLLYATFVISLPREFLAVTPKLLLIGMGAQVALAIAQVVRGESLQGLWYYLGERFVTVGSPYVATGELFGELLLRAYGTFSHPNVLAGWLVVCWLIVLSLTHTRAPQIVATVLAAIGIFLTQSRAAALSLFGIGIPFYFLSPKFRLPYFLVVTLICAALFIPLSRDLDLSLRERLSLQRVSFLITRAHPFFGTGAEASVTSYPSTTPSLRLLQPDHNSATLLLSWLGLFGLLALYPVAKVNQQTGKSLIPLIPLFLLDHYLLTSPQGLCMVLLYLRVHLSSYVQPNREQHRGSARR